MVETGFRSIFYKAINTRGYSRRVFRPLQNVETRTTTLAKDNIGRCLPRTQGQGEALTPLRSQTVVPS